MKIGFIQGRLSPIIQNRIQIFPWDYWENEFRIAKNLEINCMEWTVDSYKFDQNPLLNKTGQLKILDLIKECGVQVPSVTCDYFMEKPFWKHDKYEVKYNLNRILEAMIEIRSQILVIPLVDNATPSNNLDTIIDFFLSFKTYLKKNNLRIAFELDLPPIKAGEFIENFNSTVYGINYDLGNSASLNFDPMEELGIYFNRIINVHIKDRKKNGPTVALGAGNVNFKYILTFLKNNYYEGNYILQTARDPLGEHADTIMRYKKFVEGYLK